MNNTILRICQRIKQRSQSTRQHYLDTIQAGRKRGKASQIACSNLAHAVASHSPKEKQLLISNTRLNIGIINAYNDMLSAHKPYEHYPQAIRDACAEHQATAQVAGGVPAMCDGVTQGREGMNLSLFSRDIIAMSTAIGLSHEVFDGAVFLGVCDKIVPGLLIGALQFGHLPSLFIPAGPMTSGIANAQKKKIRQQYVEKKLGREELLESEMSAYHGIGTCTFYGTANSNQMLLEAMGLHRPNHAFFNPDNRLKPLLIEDSINQLINNVRQVGIGIGEMLSAESFVNALVALLATGGSTNHTIHWIAVAKAAGFAIDWQDFAELSEVVPQITQVYPNGSEDVNAFQQAGGPATTLKYLLDYGLLFEDVHTVNGFGLACQCQTPKLSTDTNKLIYEAAQASTDWELIRPCHTPFKSTGGIRIVKGNLGTAVVKTSALSADELSIKAPARVFESQQQVAEAYNHGDLNQSMVVVVKYQGPSSNGMPELHKLMTILGSVRSQGHSIALLTDGRLSGASGQVLAAIHLVPESGANSPLCKIQDGDIIEIDCHQNRLQVGVDEASLANRKATFSPPISNGFSQQLFQPMRNIIKPADEGATLW